MGYVKSQWQGECAVNDWIKEHESDFIPYSCSITANTATLQVANNGICWREEPLRPYYKRLYCEYCGCISDKEHGTCEHCGAPLKEMDE